MMPGMGILRRQGRENRQRLPLYREGVKAGDPGLGRPMLNKGPGKQCFWQEYTEGLYIWGCPSIGSRCHMAGQDGEEETAASQWPLVRCIYNRAQC